MRPSPSCWNNSTTAASANAKDHAPACSPNSTGPRLQPLPAERYVLAQWKTVRANIDYHVEIDRHYYSVPYQLAGQKLEARYTAATVEIFHGGKRVASHVRSSAAYRHTTVPNTCPRATRRTWNGRRRG